MQAFALGCGSLEALEDLAEDHRGSAQIRAGLKRRASPALRTATQSLPPSSTKERAVSALKTSVGEVRDIQDFHVEESSI